MSENSQELITANKAIVAEFFQSITNSDFDRAVELLNPDGEWWALSNRAARPTLVQLDRIKGLASQAKNGMSFTVEVMTAEEDRVAALVEGYAELPDRVYNNLYNFFIRVVDGRIIELRMYDDTAYGEKVLRGGTPLKSHAK